MKKMRIRRSEKSDLQEIMRIYEYAVKRMRAAGNLTQWVNGYPSSRDILADISGGNSYVLECEGRLAGVFAFVIGEDPNYSEIEGEWSDNATYGTIHRIAAAPGLGYRRPGFCFLPRFRSEYTHRHPRR